jgi:DNA-damage-inducible protein J
MSKSVNINIRMNEELKKKAEKLFSELGMNMTTAINVFVKQAVYDRGIPFKIYRDDDFFNSYNQYILRESIEELNDKRGQVHELAPDEE